MKLAGNQSLEKGTIGVPDAGMPVAAHADMRRFLVETERSWILELKSFLQQDLGLKIPITATQVNYLNANVVSETCDYADVHNYWHHPLFPSGRDWNSEEWTVQNEPMEAFPMRAGWPANSLLPRTGWRMRALPMAMTEWNYCEPARFAAGCVPMAAVLGCLQDWDAIFFFDYESFHENSPDDRPFFRTSTADFFGFNGAPAKLTAFSMFSNLFLRGDLKPLASQLLFPIDTVIDGRLAFTTRLAVDPQVVTMPDIRLPEGTLLQTPDKTVTWHNDDPTTARLILDTPATRGAWGMIARQNFAITGLDLRVRAIPGDYGILVATSMDGKPLESAQKIVLLAATHSENLDMGWNADHTSVGSRWGHGPTQVVAVQADVSLLTAMAHAKVHALDGKGEPTREIASELKGEVLRFTIDGSAKTLWYAIELE